MFTITQFCLHNSTNKEFEYILNTNADNYLKRISHFICKNTTLIKAIQNECDINLTINKQLVLKINKNDIAMVSY